MHKRTSICGLLKNRGMTLTNYFILFADLQSCDFFPFCICHRKELLDSSLVYVVYIEQFNEGMIMPFNATF